MPWKIVTDTSMNDAYYTDWQLVDVSPGSALLAIGDQVNLQIVASGCSRGPLGPRLRRRRRSTIPGPYVAATGPQAQNAGSNITYTFNYRNGGTAVAAASSVVFVTPTNTTFVSASIPGCTGLAAAGTGTETCVLGDVPVGGTGSFQITVTIDAATAPAQSSPTATTSTSRRRLAAAGPEGEHHGHRRRHVRRPRDHQDGRRRRGRLGPTGQLHHRRVQQRPGRHRGRNGHRLLPALLAAGATWTCVGTAGGTCAASGTGSINDATVGLPVGGSVTYTVNATVIAGTGTGTLSNVATVAPPVGAVDPDTTNNAAGDTDNLGTIRTLTLTKNGAQTGTMRRFPRPSSAVLAARARPAPSSTGRP